jgi:toxin YoeB
MKYKITITQNAVLDSLKLARSEPASFKKYNQLLRELEDHPTTGTGHPHMLRADKAGKWARSISKKHRLVYEIIEKEVIVLVLSTYGHYDDK